MVPGREGLREINAGQGRAARVGLPGIADQRHRRLRLAHAAPAERQQRQRNGQRQQRGHCTSPPSKRSRAAEPPHGNTEIITVRHAVTAFLGPIAARSAAASASLRATHQGAAPVSRVMFAEATTAPARACSL